MKLNTKEIQVLSVITAIWGISFISTGLVMNTKMKPIIHTKYTLQIESRKIAEAQAKTNEIKLKDIEIEINNPISVEIKDYLKEIDNLSDEVLKLLKLDTSLVNINEAGKYPYTITYNKKKYQGTITVKEKELPNMTLTLKTMEIKVGESLSSNPRSFINEEITDDVYNNLTLDISKVDTEKAGKYDYYVIYKGTTYQGKVIVSEPGPKIITKATTENDEEEKKTCPQDAREDNGTCVCNDGKDYDKETNTCKTKEATQQ